MGDKIAKALAAVGVTPEAVEAWLGQPCRCRERRDRLNAVGRWASRVLQGKIGHARRLLSAVTGDAIR